MSTKIIDLDLLTSPSTADIIPVLDVNDNNVAKRMTLGTMPLSTPTQTALDLKLNATAVSAFGLTLVDDADATTARATLGLGTLATQSGTFSGTSSGTNTGDNATNSQYSGLASSKQDTLISGTNIKTVGGTSLLGSGDVPVGTVTAVSIATANGFSGSSSGGATPALTIIAGAITPTSINGNAITAGTGTLALSTFTLTVAGTASITGTNTGDQTTVSGNAGTATTLQNARTINGVSFNGSANIFSYIFVGTSSGAATTGANVTPVDVPGLVWTYEANSTYVFRWIGGITSTAATTGVGFQLNVSSAITRIQMTFVHQLAAGVSGTLTGGSSNADDASLGTSSAQPATTTNPVTGWGLLVTGANTGTAQLRFRSETTAVTSFDIGAVLVVEKVI